MPRFNLNQKVNDLNVMYGGLEGKPSNFEVITETLTLELGPKFNLFGMPMVGSTGCAGCTGCQWNGLTGANSGFIGCTGCTGCTGYFITPSPTRTPTPTPKPSDFVGSPAFWGIIGGVLGLLLLIFFIFAIVKLLKKKKST